MSGDANELERIIEDGLDCLQAGDTSGALRLAEQALALDESLGEAHELRALALTMRGDLDAADAAFERAAKQDPEQWFRPYRLEREAFDAAVEAVLLALPEPFQEYLDNVEVGVEDVPGPELLEDDVDFDVLGLYIGSTASGDDWDFPDRVILFQRNLENISPDAETLNAEIRDTLLHEVGHHFGMDEETLREIEGDESDG